jgi:hypothetical protein
MRLIRILGALIVSLQLIAPNLCLGQELSPSPAQNETVNLDLSSTERSMQYAGNVHDPVSLSVGDNSKVVNHLDLLTPAEFLALNQILMTGSQSLILSEHGSAIGGSVILSQLSISQLSGLVIPNGVTAIHDFAQNTSLNVIGNFVNNGSLYAVTSNASTTNANISTTNLFNNSTGIISSVLPNSGLGLLGNYFSGLNLNLIATNDLINNGIISSAGSLNITAGGNVVNAAVNGVSPIMQAAQNINIISGAGSLINSGVITSSLANINVNSQLTNNILINNTNGLMQALQGNINVRDLSFIDKANLDFMGGDIQTNNLNLYTGKGIANAHVNDLIGTVNIYGHEAHVSAATGSLSIGKIELGGDPTFYNAAGDIVINSDMIFHGENLAFIAKGSIIAGNGSGVINIDTSSTTGNGGNILMIAGVNFLTSGTGLSSPYNQSADWNTSTVSIVGATVEGGRIDLNTLGTMSSASTVGNGGNVTLIAYAGLNNGSGTINLGSNSNIVTSGSTASGNVNIFGNGVLTDPTNGARSIVVGNINTSGSNNGGDITIKTSAPNLGIALVSPSVDVVNGNIVAGSFNFNSLFESGAGSIQTNNLIASGSDISLKADGSILTGSITNNAISGNGGTVTINASYSDDNNGGIYVVPFIIGNSATENGVRGTISVNAGINGGSGGQINITTYHNLNLESVNNLSAQATASGGNPAGGNGGSISLIVSTGILQMATGNLSVNAADNGNNNGGTVNLQGAYFQLADGHLSISANATGNGNGGTIALYGDGSNGNGLQIGNGSGQISITANGGSSGSTSGNGGVITVNSNGETVGDGFGSPGTSLVVDPSAINAGPLGTNGNGASITLKGDGLTVTGDLFADGVGTGNGGSIYLGSQSTSLFEIKGAGGCTNCTRGQVTAKGGNVSGNGGTIEVNVVGGSSGGIRFLDYTQLSVNPTNGNGGTLKLIASAGPLIFEDGVLAVNGAGVGNYNGGQIYLQGKGTSTNNAQRGIQVNDGAVLNSGVLLFQANAVGTGNGGLIDIFTDPFGNTTGAQQATGALKIGGNTVVINGTSYSGNIQLSARGGPTSGNGGTVNIVVSGGSTRIDPSHINVGPLGTSGNGGNISIVVGRTLQVDGNINVSGVGTGNGGTVLVQTNAPSLNGGLEIGGPNGGALQAYVNGNLIANSGNAGGNGGGVSIINTGNGGIDVINVNNIQVAPLVSGNGGTIYIKSTSGAVDIPYSEIDVSAAGTGNGGSVTIETSQLIYNNSGSVPLTLNIKGAGTGTNGSANIFITNSSATYTVGDQAGNLKILGYGNSSSISVRSGNVLVVNATGLVRDHNLANENGSSVSFTGANSVTVNNSIDVSGVGNGNGGSILIDSGDAIAVEGNLIVNAGTTGNAGTITLIFAGFSGAFVDGNIQANAGQNGNGGIINITHIGDNTFAINNSGCGECLLSGTISARGGTSSGNGGQVNIETSSNDATINPSIINVSPYNGNGGSISIENHNGDSLTILSGTLNASAATNGNGGTIFIQSPFLFVSGVGPLILTANGAGTGNGGQITVWTEDEDSDITIGNGNGQISVSATGGSNNSASGDGGKLTVRRGRTLTVNTDAMNLNPLGTNGKGATIELLGMLDSVVISGTILPVEIGGTGNLDIIGDLHADGVGTGLGGIIKLAGNENGNFVVSGDITANTSAPALAGEAGQIFIYANNIDLQNSISTYSSASITEDSDVGLGQIAFVFRNPDNFIAKQLSVKPSDPNSVGGSITGMITAFGSASDLSQPAIYIESRVPGSVITTDLVGSGGGDVTIKSDTLGSSIVIPDTGVIYAINGNINLFTPHLHHDGNIVGVTSASSNQSHDINISSSIGSLLITGTGSTGFSGGGGGNIIISAPGSITLRGALVFDALNGQFLVNGYGLSSTYSLAGRVFTLTLDAPVTYPDINAVISSRSNKKNENQSAAAENTANDNDRSFIQVMSKLRGDLVVFTRANQVFMGSTDSGGYEAIGSVGTVVSRNKNVITLHTGQLAIKNGRGKMQVNVNNNIVDIEPNTIAVIEADRDRRKPTKVKSVSGGKKSVIVKNTNAEIESIGPGEEILISQSDLGDEELVSIYETDEAITGGIQIEKKKMTKKAFNPDNITPKEMMIGGHRISVGTMTKKTTHNTVRKISSENKAYNEHKVTHVLHNAIPKLDNKKVVQKTAIEDSGFATAIESIFSSLEQAALEGIQGNISETYSFEFDSKTSPLFVLAAPTTMFRTSDEGNLEVKSGAIFVNAVDDMTFSGPASAKVLVGKNGKVVVESKPGSMRVRACSGPGHISVNLEGRSIELNPGEEVLIADHNLNSREISPDDGIGRRQSKTLKIHDNLQVAVSEFSILGMLMTSDYLSSLRSASSKESKQVLNDILKTVVALQLVTGSHGQYSSSSKLPATSMNKTDDQATGL